MTKTSPCPNNTPSIATLSFYCFGFEEPDVVQSNIFKGRFTVNRRRLQANIATDRSFLLSSQKKLAERVIFF